MARRPIQDAPNASGQEAGAELDAAANDDDASAKHGETRIEAELSGKENKADEEEKKEE